MSNSEFYVKRVKIEGLFGQKNIDWHLNEDVNILGGINGSGKSTVIDLLKKILNFSGAITKQNLSSLCLYIDFAEIEFLNNQKLIFRKKVDGEDRYTNTRFEDIIYIRAMGSDSLERKISVFLYGEVPDICISYLGSAEHQIVSEEVIKGIGNDKIKTTLDLSLFQEIRKRNELVANSSLKGEESLKYILESNNLLFKTINDFFKDTNKSLKKESSTFDISIKDKTISCYNLSTGEKQLLLILLTAFNTNGQPSIMLMDEPDLGIHIDWKKKLITSIRNINSKAQLILSTHSPSMLEGGWFDNVQEMNQISTNI